MVFKSLGCGSAHAQVEDFRPVEFNGRDFVSFEADRRLDMGAEGTLEIWLAEEQGMDPLEALIAPPVTVLSLGDGKDTCLRVVLGRGMDRVGIEFPAMGARVVAWCPFSDGNFHHLAFITKDGKTSIVVDGGEPGEPAAGTYALGVDGGRALHLGSDGLKAGFKGAIFTVRFWNKALTAEELGWAKEFHSVPDKANDAIGRLVAASFFTSEHESLIYQEPPVVVLPLMGSDEGDITSVQAPRGYLISEIHFLPAAAPAVGIKDVKVRLTAKGLPDLLLPAGLNDDFPSGWRSFVLPADANLYSVAGTMAGDVVSSLRLLATKAFESGEQLDSGVIPAAVSALRPFAQVIPQGARCTGLRWREFRGQVSAIGTTCSTPELTAEEKRLAALEPGRWVDEDARLPQLDGDVFERERRRAMISAQAPVSGVTPLTTATQEVKMGEMKRKIQLVRDALALLRIYAPPDEATIIAIYNSLGPNVGIFGANRIVFDVISEAANEAARTVKSQRTPSKISLNALVNLVRTAKTLSAEISADFIKPKEEDAELAEASAPQGLTGQLAGALANLTSTASWRVLNPSALPNEAELTTVLTELFTHLNNQWNPMVMLKEPREKARHGVYTTPPVVKMGYERGSQDLLFSADPGPVKEFQFAGTSYQSAQRNITYVAPAGGALNRIELNERGGPDGLTYRLDLAGAGRIFCDINLQARWPRVAVGGIIEGEPLLSAPRRLVKASPYDSPGNDRLEWGGTFALADRPTLSTANFRGYNLRYLHPRDHQADTGADKLVFKYPSDLSKDYYATDNKIIVPFGLHFRSVNEGDEGSKTDTVRTAEERSDSWSNHIGANIGTPFFSASVNASWQNENSSLQKAAHTRAICRTVSTHYALVIDKARVQLSDDFYGRVLELRDRYLAAGQLPLSAMRPLIEGFGTHYPFAVTYGGMACMEMDFTETEVQQAKMDGYSVEASASGGFGGISGGVSAGHSETHKASSDRAQSRERVTFHTFGGSMSKGQGWSLQKGEEVPIYLDLRPLPELLSPIFFEDECISEVIRDKLAQAITLYLAGKPVEDTTR